MKPLEHGIAGNPANERDEIFGDNEAREMSARERTRASVTEARFERNEVSRRKDRAIYFTRKVLCQ
jgi:hypothetical protein